MPDTRFYCASTRSFSKARYLFNTRQICAKISVVSHVTVNMNTEHVYDKVCTRIKQEDFFRVYMAWSKYEGKLGDFETVMSKILPFSTMYRSGYANTEKSPVLLLQNISQK